MIKTLNIGDHITLPMQRGIRDEEYVLCILHSFPPTLRLFSVNTGEGFGCPDGVVVHDPARLTSDEIYDLCDGIDLDFVFTKPALPSLYHRKEAHHAR